MNILITSASRKVSLVRTFQQALAQEGGGEVIAVDASPQASALYFADDHYLMPGGDEQRSVGNIIRLCEERSIRLVIPTRDEELPAFAEHTARFDELGTLVMVPGVDVVRICQDKRQFLNFCLGNDFGAPKTYETSRLPEAAEFPIFVKPHFGKGGKGAQRVDSRAQLDLILQADPDVLIQELVQDPEYTIDLFADFSGTVISAVPRQRIQVFGGESFVSRTFNDPRLIEESARLATSLGLVGHNTIQCFFDGSLIRFIEVNPRFGGGANLGFAAGASTPHMLVKLLMGRPVPSMLGQFKDDYLMLRYTEDIFMDAESLTWKNFLAN